MKNLDRNVQAILFFLSSIHYKFYEFQMWEILIFGQNGAHFPFSLKRCKLRRYLRDLQIKFFLYNT